jgi:hypothetical protein
METVLLIMLLVGIIKALVIPRMVETVVSPSRMEPSDTVAD